MRFLGVLAAAGIIGAFGVGCSKVSSPMSPAIESADDGAAPSSKAMAEAVPRIVLELNKIPVLPSGIVGEQNFRIASFTITSGADPIIFSKLVLKNREIQELALGNDFQNLKVFVNGHQVGVTIGMLSTAASTSYNFRVNERMAPRTTWVIDVFADILSVPKNLNRIFPAVILDRVVLYQVVSKDSEGFERLRMITLRPGLLGQGVFIADSGKLIVSLNADNPVSNILKTGRLATDLLKIDLASRFEDVLVSRIIVSYEILDNGINPGFAPFTFYNFELWDGITKIAGPVSLVYIPGAGLSFVDFDLYEVNFVVPRNASKTLAVRASVNPKLWSSGSAHRVYLTSDYPLKDGKTRAITARGFASAMAMDGPEKEIYGNPMIIRQDFPIIEYLNPPSGQALRYNQVQTVLYRFKVSSIPGGTGIAVKKFPFSLTMVEENALTSPLTLSNFRIRRDGLALYTTNYDIFSQDPRGAEPRLNLKERALAPKDMAGEGYDGHSIGFDVFISVIFWEQEEISALTSAVYELVADVSGGGIGVDQDGDLVAVRMGSEIIAEPVPWVVNGDLFLDPTDQGVSIEGRLSRLIWSDTGGAKWTNGWLVRTSPVHNTYLPLSIHTLLP